MSQVDNEAVSLIQHLIQEGYSQRKACQEAGIPESTYRTWKTRGKITNIEKPLAAGTLIKPHKKRGTLFGKKYVFTSAQNNTYVHKDFLKTLEMYCLYNDAELIVGTFYYNKNGFQKGPQEDTWFDPAIRPYIRDESLNVFKGLVWCGELNILPTAVDPLSGLDTYTREASGIVPHTKLRLKSLPTAKSEPCRMMYTTGCVTKANYIPMKSGQKAEFHHVYSALVAEVDEDGDWFVRQLVSDSDSGCFYDLTNYYTPNEVYTNVRVEALNYGDIHSEKPDKEVFEATFGYGGLLDTLKPKYQFCHDTLDFTTRNHHRIKDIYHRYEMQIKNDGKDRVFSDILKAVNTLNYMDRVWCETVVVESNHDLAFTRWLRESDPKTDNIWNAMLYHRCQLRVLESIANEEEGFSIFEWVVNDICKKQGYDIDPIFLREDESFVICQDESGGIECGNHGHLGANGSRGTIQTYVKLGKRQNIGHSHSAGIMDGVYVAGIKGNLEQGYNSGGSSWSHSDIITYQNGKRAIITFKGNKWRA